MTNFITTQLIIHRPGIEPWASDVGIIDLYRDTFRHIGGQFSFCFVFCDNFQ